MTSSENIYENKLADVVRGRGTNRLASGPSGNSSVSSSIRANSTTPSPVATPAPVSVVVGVQATNATHSQSSPVPSHQPVANQIQDETRHIEVCESMLDDLAFTSSQEEEIVAPVQESRVSQDAQGLVESTANNPPQG